MEIVTYAVTALVTAGLVGLGGYLCWVGQTGAATAALSFGFLALVLLHLAKFKRFKGFGFEGETWDQEQVKAAELRKNLSEMSVSLTQQVALLAAKVGYWDSALSLEELGAVIQQTEKMLKNVDISAETKNDLLAPIGRRIEQYYWQKAGDILRHALAKEQRITQARLNATPADPPEARGALQPKLTALQTAIEQTNAFTLEIFMRSHRLSTLSDIVNGNLQFLGDHERVVREFGAVNSDLEFFAEKGRVRNH